MVLFFALSAKSAITAGAIIGGTVALYANREKIIEYLSTEWNLFCGELRTEKIKLAYDLDDLDELKFLDSEISTPSTTPPMSADITPTSSNSDVEWDEWSRCSDVSVASKASSGNAVTTGYEMWLERSYDLD